MQSSKKAVGRWKIRLDFRGRRRERGGAQVAWIARHGEAKVAAQVADPVWHGGAKVCRRRPAQRGTAERMGQRPGGRPRVAWRSEGLPPAACPARHGVRLRKPRKPKPLLAFSERPAAKAAGLRRKSQSFMSYGRQQPNGVPRISFSAGRHTSQPCSCRRRSCAPALTACGILHLLGCGAEIVRRKTRCRARDTGSA